MISHTVIYLYNDRNDSFSFRISSKPLNGFTSSIEIRAHTIRVGSVVVVRIAVVVDISEV